MGDIRTGQDVSLRDENSLQALWGAHQGTNVPDTHLAATVGYARHSDSFPDITDDNYSDLRCDKQGRLIVTSQAGGVAVHTIIDDAVNPLEFQATVHPDGFLRTKPLGAPMVYDNFSLEEFDVAKWDVYGVVGAGAYTQADAQLTLSTGLGATDAVEIRSRGSWEFFAHSTHEVYYAVHFDDPTGETNNEKFFGVGANDDDGYYFIIKDGVMYTRTLFEGDSPVDVDVNSHMPIDGKIHDYQIIYRDNYVVFYIDQLVVDIREAFDTDKDYMKYSKVKVHFDMFNTGVPGVQPGDLNIHNIGLFDDSTQQIVVGRSNLGQRFTNELLVDEDLSNPVSSYWHTVQSYTIPGPNIMELMGFRSSSSTGNCWSRITSRKTLGSYDYATTTFTPLVDYDPPRFASVLELIFTNGTPAQNGTATVTYINENGTPGRVGTIEIPKNLASGVKISVPLQAGDVGVIDVTGATYDQSADFVISGGTELCRHFHSSADIVSETTFAKESIMLAGFDRVELEIWTGNTNTYRRFISSIYTIS